MDFKSDLLRIHEAYNQDKHREKLKMQSISQHFQVDIFYGKFFFTDLAEKYFFLRVLTEKCVLRF